MDYLIMGAVFVAVLVILKFLKSILKFMLTLAVLMAVIYYLDLQGIISIAPILKDLGI